jgi:hypothetical protein
MIRQLAAPRYPYGDDAVTPLPGHGSRADGVRMRRVMGSCRFIASMALALPLGSGIGTLLRVGAPSVDVSTDFL